MAINKTKRKYIVNVATIILIAAFAVYYLTKSDYITPESIAKIRFYDILLIFTFFIVGLAILSLLDCLVYKSFTNDMCFSKCFINTLCGNLGSGVTPFKSAHFPLMAYYQFNSGVPLADTVTGLTKCQVIYSATSIVVYATVTVVLAITGLTFVFEGVRVSLWIVVCVGLAFHLAVFVAICLIAFNMPLQKWALRLWVSLVKRLKKNFNEQEYLTQKTIKLQIFKQQITIVGKNFARYIFPCALYFIYMIVFAGNAQYLSYLLITHKAFSLESLFLFYTLHLASAYITNVIPVPGGVGTAELMFTLVFAFVIPDKAIIGAVLILWRVATYYLPIVVELVVFAFATLLGKRKKFEK